MLARYCKGDTLGKHKKVKIGYFGVVKCSSQVSSLPSSMLPSSESVSSRCSSLSLSPCVQAFKSSKFYLVPYLPHIITCLYHLPHSMNEVSHVEPLTNTSSSQQDLLP